MRTRLAWLMLASLPLVGCKKPQKETAHPGPEHHAHWAYEGEEGPDHWGELEASYQLCAKGKAQSPINIEKTTHNEGLGALTFSYQESPLSLVNNGHTIQVNYAQGSKIAFHGSEYELIQFHFHDPSEHMIEGTSYPMELHLVHKSSSGELAVVGVMLKEGGENSSLASFWSQMPSTQTTIKTEIKLNASSLLPANTHYFTYQGSLTTPSCSEGVRWIVLKEPATISTEQIGKFASIVGKNARPPQPLNARLIEDY